MRLTSCAVDLVGADDPAWEEWLDGVPRDVYHTAGYHTYARDSGEGEPYLLVVGGRRTGIAWPYLLRQVAEVEGLAGSTATDVNSVYGYPGPLAWGCRPGDPFLERAWCEILAVWREQRAVSAFSRFHPLLDNASLVSGLSWTADAGDGPGPLVAGGLTVSIDLTVSDLAAREAYARGLRREIDASRRAGLTTEYDEDWTHLATFTRLYRETMVRNRAAEYYFFGLRDFERLRAALSGRLHLLVTHVDGEVAAAGLFTEFAGIVQVYLVATNDKYRRLSPYKVLLDDARRWAREHGNTVLHLGGGRGGREDTLFWFKSRFSPRRHPFYTGRWILDRTAYRDLLEARLSSGAARDTRDEDFFPAYRAPLMVPGKRDGLQQDR